MKAICILLFVLLVELIAPWNPRDNHENGAAQAQQPGGSQPYHFRPEDSRILREKYPDWDRVNLSHRSHYAAGDRLPEDWRSRMQPVPIEAVRELVLPPSEDVFGYIDGYCVAYDPNTLVIADAIDLATFETNKKPR